MACHLGFDSIQMPMCVNRISPFGSGDTLATVFLAKQQTAISKSGRSTLDIEV